MDKNHSNENIEKKIIAYIEAIIKFELDRTKKEHDETFNTAHEGWAVTKEEIEESYDVFKDLSFSINLIDRNFEELKQFHSSDLWNEIKKDNFFSIMAEYTKIFKHTKKMIFELIQVAAMANKNIESIKEYISRSKEVNIKND